MQEVVVVRENDKLFIPGPEGDVCDVSGSGERRSGNTYVYCCQEIQMARSVTRISRAMAGEGFDRRLGRRIGGNNVLTLQYIRPHQIFNSCMSHFYQTGGHYSLPNTLLLVSGCSPYQKHFTFREHEATRDKLRFSTGRRKEDTRMNKI